MKYPMCSFLELKVSSTLKVSVRIYVERCHRNNLRASQQKLLVLVCLKYPSEAYKIEGDGSPSSHPKNVETIGTGGTLAPSLK